MLQPLPDLPHIDSYNPEGLPLPDGHPDNHPKALLVLADQPQGQVLMQGEKLLLRNARALFGK